jgi:hypothetical protein
MLDDTRDKQATQAQALVDSADKKTRPPNSQTPTPVANSASLLVSQPSIPNAMLQPAPQTAISRRSASIHPDSVSSLLLIINSLF